MNLYIRIVLFLAVIFVSQFGCAASEFNQAVISDLRSANPVAVRSAVKKIAASDGYETEILDKMAERLLQEYMAKNPLMLDAMSWVCIVLGRSENNRYYSVLHEVALHAADRKLNKHAKKALIKLHQDDTPQYLRGMTVVSRWADVNDTTEEEYTPYLSVGKAAIVGQAFLAQRGGGVVKAAGRVVTLDPATSTGWDWWKESSLYWDLRAATPDSPGFQRARRTVTADAEGRFKFENIPLGKYFLRTEVTWIVVQGEFEGGLVGVVVDVTKERDNEVIVNTILGAN